MSPSRMPGRVLSITAGVAAAAAPRIAEAHLASTRFGDFYGGALHVGSAPEHLLALLALGLYAALQERLAARWIVLAAPLGLLCGAGLAKLVPLTAPSPAVAMVLLAMVGLLIALRWQLPVALLMLLGLLVGLVHGYQNGLAASERTAAALFALGVTAMGLIALALIASAAVAAIAKAGWATVAIRAGGSWIAAIGIMMLGLGFA